IGAPYDRERTTMASFAMCSECRAEYEDPSNRRFHAQATACPHCGPRIEFRSATQPNQYGEEALTAFIAAIRDGRIGAVKGLGGFHLVCDARRADVVAELRRRKHRDEKPFAIMVRNSAAALLFCEI